MRKVDRLLIKVQEAVKLDAMQVSVAFVEPDGDKWKAIVDLWDGVPSGKAERLILNADTQEEALAAIDEVQATHAPIGKRAYTGYEPTIIIDDIMPD